MKTNLNRHQREFLRPTAAFTLVEILIIVVILSILAVAVIPQFSDASVATRENTAQMDLHRIRTQLEIYKIQHNGNNPSLANIVDQMQLASKADGTTAAPGTPGYGLGPYLRNFPANPFNDDNSVGNGAVGTSGWYYDETTGAFHANHDATARAEW